MQSKYFLVVGFAIVAGYWDACIASWFSVPFSSMRFVLPFAVILALFSSSIIKPFVAAIVGGSVAELFLASQGLMPIRLVISIIVLHILARYVITNRSLWGICFLGSVAVLVDRMLLFLLHRLPAASGGLRTLEAHAPLWMELMWMCIVCGSAFMFFAAFSRRFHPALSRIDQMNRLPWG